MDLKQRAKQVTAEIPAVFMALKDRETPWPAKRMAGITAAYVLSPIDLVCSRQRAAQCLDKGLGKKWYFALPILLLWGAGLALLVWLLV